MEIASGVVFARRPAESIAAQPASAAARRPRETVAAEPPTAPPPSAAEVRVRWGEPDLGGDAAERLAAVAERVAVCTRCPLHAGRRNAVPGEGDPKARVMFVGEGPGADEDAQGRPFVGAAGRLLDKMIAAMGLAREEVFIANIVKCRPPGNRTPEPEECATCGSFLSEQIAAVSPKVICTLGNTPLKALSGDDRGGITRRRGKPFRYRDFTVIPTFHPSYLLRNEQAKKPAWEDLKEVLKVLGRSPPTPT